jgi:hypothetical protein
VVVLKVFAITKDPLVFLTLLEANIEVDLTTSSLNMCANALLISLLYFTSITSVALVEDIVLLNPLSIAVLNNKSKTLGKCPRLKMLKGRIRARNNSVISRLHIIDFRNTLSYASNLVSKLVVNSGYISG